MIKMTVRELRVKLRDLDKIEDWLRMQKLNKTMDDLYLEDAADAIEEYIELLNDIEVNI